MSCQVASSCVLARSRLTSCRGCVIMSGMTHIRRALIRNLTLALALAALGTLALVLDVVSGYVVMGMLYVAP